MDDPGIQIAREAARLPRAHVQELFAIAQTTSELGRRTTLSKYACETEVMLELYESGLISIVSQGAAMRGVELSRNGWLVLLRRIEGDLPWLLPPSNEDDGG